jgi:hypothetical protein
VTDPRLLHLGRPARAQGLVKHRGLAGPPSRVRCAASPVQHRDSDAAGSRLAARPRLRLGPPGAGPNLHRGVGRREALTSSGTPSDAGASSSPSYRAVRQSSARVADRARRGRIFAVPSRRKHPSVQQRAPRTTEHRLGWRNGGVSFSQFRRATTLAPLAHNVVRPPWHGRARPPSTPIRRRSKIIDHRPPKCNAVSPSSN